MAQSRKRWYREYKKIEEGNKSFKDEYNVLRKIYLDMGTIPYLIVHMLDFLYKKSRFFTRSNRLLTLFAARNARLTLELAYARARIAELENNQVQARSARARYNKLREEAFEDAITKVLRDRPKLNENVDAAQ